MTILDIIKQLEKQGHEIDYSKRKDGGYIIRYIDGKHFAGKTGNAFARRLAGYEISVARKVQLQRIRTPKGKRPQKQDELPPELLKELRKVQRAWRKKHPTIEGTASLRGLRYQYKMYGKEVARASLDKAYRYSQGLAYIDNVLHLIERIRLDLNKLPSPEMENVMNLIEQKEMSFKEEWIAPIYSALYDWERGIIEGKECARIIKNIMM